MCEGRLSRLREVKQLPTNFGASMAKYFAFWSSMPSSGQKQESVGTDTLTLRIGYMFRRFFIACAASGGLHFVHKDSLTLATATEFHRPHQTSVGTRSQAKDDPSRP